MSNKGTKRKTAYFAVEERGGKKRRADWWRGAGGLLELWIEVLSFATGTNKACGNIAHGDGGEGFLRKKMETHRDRRSGTQFVQKALGVETGDSMR